MSNSLQKDTKVLLRRARYEEVWMMPEGSRSELGRLRVLDRGRAKGPDLEVMSSDW